MTTKEIILLQIFILISTTIIVMLTTNETSHFNPLFIINITVLTLGVIIFTMQSEKIWYMFSLLSMYSISGIIFALEVISYLNNQNNKQWFLERYTMKMLKFEIVLFFPIIWLLYLVSFRLLSPKKALNDMKNIFENQE